MFRDFGRRLQRDLKRQVDARLRVSEELSSGRIKVKYFRLFPRFVAHDFAGMSKGLNKQHGRRAEVILKSSAQLTNAISCYSKCKKTTLDLSVLITTISQNMKATKF